MKLRIILIGALALFAGSALAQTATLSIRWALVPLDARTTFVSQHDTQAQCDAAARAANRTRVYTCERRLDAVAAVVVPPTCTTPRPAASQILQCPAGQTGSWTQTRTVTAATYPTCWETGAWTPAGAPAGACTPIVTPPPPPPATPELTYVDPAKVPLARGGSPERRIRSDGSVPYRDPDGMGAFRTVCQPSHFNFDDPLVFPGVRNATHLHLFWGNTGADAFSSPESIRTTGNGSCRGGIVNRSSYWVPALVAPGGRPLVPAPDIDIYYKTGYDLFGQNAAVQPFPAGFRMIAGDSKSRAMQPRAYFECNGSRMSTLGACSGQLEQVVEFPQCWDGRNLTSPDNRSHVVYASGGRCPATHPNQLPQISYIVKYQNVPAGTRLSSDINGAPAGSSAHGDWMNGWEQEVFDTAVQRIIRQGLSGGSHMVGDGRSLY